MKELIEIARVVFRLHKRKLDLSGQMGPSKAKSNAFMKALLNGEIETDAQAARMLYDSTPTDVRYRQLKSRIRRRLLDLLPGPDGEDSDLMPEQRSRLSADREWAMARMLWSHGAKESASQLAERVWAVAVQHKFTDLVVQSAVLIREHFSQLARVREYERFDQSLQSHWPIYQAEIEARSEFEIVLLATASTDPFAEGAVERIQKCCEQLIVLSERFDSPSIMQLTLLADALRCEWLQDYATAIEISDRAFVFLAENKMYTCPHKSFSFDLLTLRCHLYLRDYTNGKSAAEARLSMYALGTPAWYRITELFFLLSMHTGKYLNALAVQQEVLSGEPVKDGSAAEAKRWQVYGLYLHLVFETDRAEKAHFHGSKRLASRWNAWLGDRKRDGIEDSDWFFPLAVARICLLLLKKKNPLAATCAARLDEHLAKTRHRLSERSRLFWKMLRTVAQKGIRPDNGRLVDKYHRALLAMTYRHCDSEDCTEILPYEKLWALLLTKADR